MTINHRFYILIGVVFILFSLNLASAQTIVAGKVYNSEYSSIIPDTNITVTCNSHSLSTTSLDDGTYAVRFEPADCILGDSVQVISDKGELSSSGSGSVVECDNDSCNGDPFAIINLAMKTKQTISSASIGTYSNGNSVSRGSARIGFYLCGNGKCDSGETATTCPKDCKTVVANLTNSVDNQATNAAGEVDLKETTNTAEPGSDITSNGITGAIISRLGSPGMILAISFLAVLIILAIIVRSTRKRKKLSPSYLFDSKRFSFV